MLGIINRLVTIATNFNHVTLIIPTIEMILNKFTSACLVYVITLRKLSRDSNALDFGFLDCNLNRKAVQFKAINLEEFMGFFFNIGFIVREVVKKPQSSKFAVGTSHVKSI